MQATAYASSFSWRFAMVIGIAVIALGNSSVGAGAASPISVVPRPAASMRTDSEDRIANALFGDEARCSASRQPVAVPSLADVSANTRTSRLFTVTGSGFTAGGRVYLALYDQLGTQLHSTRWITASLPLLAPTGPTGHEAASLPELGGGGTFHEAFTDLCGATGTMRAYDQATATWSTWVTIEPACEASVELRTDPR